MSEDLLKLMENWKGFNKVRGTPVQEQALAATVDLMMNKDRLSKRMHEARLEEAITTSDFPYLFGQVIDRQLLANYKAVFSDWKTYVKMSTVPDFNTVRREKLLGSDNTLAVVPEKSEYAPVLPVNCRYSYAVKKYGRQFDISWESLINDSLGAFNDIPTRFATAALRSEARFVTGLFAANGGQGSNPLLYGDHTITDCGQTVTNSGHLTLTIANLEATLALMAAQTDPNGETIAVRGIHLVVPPALEFTARAILTSALKQWTDTAAATNFPLPTTNIVPQLGLQLHVDPYLPVIQGANTAPGSWFLFADPSQGAALEFAYLRGYESPEIVMKASDKVAVGGGGLSSPFTGDFATDNVMYRVRHVFGGIQMDPRMTYYQEGQA